MKYKQRKKEVLLQLLHQRKLEEMDRVIGLWLVDPYNVNTLTVNATDPICVKLEPENCGWFLDEYLKPVGFIGDHTLLKIEDIVKKSETESDDEEDSEVEDRSFMSDDSDSE
ncbi:unnamed protein product, partial [Brenthis ino]